MYVLIGEDKRVYGLSDDLVKLQEVASKRNFGACVDWRKAYTTDKDVVDIVGCNCTPISCGVVYGTTFAYYIMLHEVIK